MTEVPGGFVSARAEHPMQLMSAHALLAMEQEEDDSKPRHQGIVGILEHRPRDDAEAIAVLLVANNDLASLWYGGLLAAFTQIMERPSFEDVSLCATTWALDDALRPALLLQKCLASCLIRKALDQFAQRHVLCRIHARNHRRNPVQCQEPDISPGKPVILQAGKELRNYTV